jgi:CubicO group peptidase (beta-lactamase class C family)
VLLAALTMVMSSVRVHAQGAPQAGKPDASVERRIQELGPKLDAYVASGMKALDVPGVAIGIVAGDKLVYSKGWGVRKKGGAAVDPKTVFGIGSATKAFLSTTMARAVDHKKFHWDDRVVDLDPDFQLRDPWVTREFRVFDLLAQRSGMPPYANDMLGILGYDENAMVRSLRWVEPVSSFRSTFAYTNITHLVAGRIVAKAEGAADWNAVCRGELLEPLGMKDTTYTADAIKAAPNHAEGHRYTPEGSVEVPFDQFFPYNFGGAGDINSNIEDMAHWVRLQLGNSSLESRPIVSAQNLAVTRIPRVGMSDKVAYALGWIIAQTPNGTMVWHNGGTPGIGAFVGMEFDRHFGVIVLTNQGNVGFPDAVGLWTLDRLLGNPQADQVGETVKRAKQRYADDDKMFAKPANPKPAVAVAALAGDFSNASFGKASLKHDGDGLVLGLSSGAQFKLEPWDGDVFTARIVPEGRFASIAENMGPRPSGFVQFQMDKEGKLNLLRLSFDDGQAYEFRREAGSAVAASR